MSGGALRQAQGERNGIARAGRTVLLCIPSGTPAANILRTSVFPLIRDDPAVGTVVILSPLVGEKHFADEFAHQKVQFEPLLPYEPGWLERRFIRIMQEKFVKTMPTESMRIRVARAAKVEQEIRYLDRAPLAAQTTGSRRLALRALQAVPLPIEGWFRVSDAFTLKSQYRDLFNRYHPDLLVTPTTGLYFGEGPVLGRADRVGVPAVAIDLSWDHFTTKTAPLRRAAGLSVWNNLMKRESMALHGYREGQVAVSGVPQFDVYADKSRLEPREAFLNRIGGDPGRRLITLTTIPPVLYRFHPEIIEALLRAIEADEFGIPCQVLVRVHPRDDLAQYDRFLGRPHVVVEKPFRETVVAEGSNVDPSLADRLHLANTLYHSDVVVNVASTIAIEAAIMDTPIVNLAYDGSQTRDYLDSARRYYDYTHYRPVVEAGAVRLAHDDRELIHLVRHYLQHPELDREGRARAVELLCHRVDGKSGERVAEFVLRALVRV